MVSLLLSITFGCGLLIAGAHVVNRRFIAPVYDVAANLVAFVCASTASGLLGHPTSAALSATAVCCWLVLARRTWRARRAGLRPTGLDLTPRNSVPMATMSPETRPGQ